MFKLHSAHPPPLKMKCLYSFIQFFQIKSVKTHQIGHQIGTIETRPERSTWLTFTWIVIIQSCGYVDHWFVVYWSRWRGTGASIGTWTKTLLPSARWSTRWTLLQVCIFISHFALFRMLENYNVFVPFVRLLQLRITARTRFMDLQFA